jgi:hypothetical protein
MRILWLGPNYRHRYNAGHEHFADAVEAHFMYSSSPSDGFIRYGHGIGPTPACYLWGQGTHVPDLVSEYRPDVLVVQHPRHCKQYTGIDQVKLPKVCLITDYFPRNHDLKNAFLKDNRFNLALFPERYMIRQAETFQMRRRLPENLKCFWLPFSVDTSIFRPLNLPYKYDAMCLFSGSLNGGYPNRESVSQVLQKTYGQKAFSRILYNSTGKVLHEDYVRLINQSRIAVTSNDSYGSVNFKHFEYPACKTLMFSDKAQDFEALGYRAGIHYIQYQYANELPELLDYSLNHTDEAERIATAGYELVREKHNTYTRAKQMIELIEKLL